MAWKKPKWVQKAQTAVAKALPPPPPAPKVIQNIQRAADKVGDVIRPAAQSVAKEVGHIVNPIAGEVALRAKQIANDPNVKKAGDAIVNNVINPIGASAPMKTVQKAAEQAAGAVQQAPNNAIQSIQKIVRDTPSNSQNSNNIGEFMPYFFNKLPDAVGDIARGTGRTAAGLITANPDKIKSGAEMVGRGAWDAGKHTIYGVLPFMNKATQNTDGTMGGGRSGGAAVSEIPVPAEDTDDTLTLPPGAESESNIGTKQPKNKPIPPVNTPLSLLRQQGMPKLPKRFKARRR